MGKNDLRNWLTLGVAALVAVTASLIASHWLGGFVALALMIFVFVPLGVSVARLVTGRDLMAELGFSGRSHDA